MRFSNLHMHSIFSDGKSQMEEYVQAAIKKGFVSIGFSDHSPLLFEDARLQDVMTEHMSPERYQGYITTIKKLKEKYLGQIEIYAGIEEDCYPFQHREGLDYNIGAVHFIEAPSSVYYLIDFSKEELLLAAEDFGSLEKVVVAYYERLTWIVTTYQPTIIAHIDLVTKFNEGNALFDTKEAWYRRIVLSTLDVIEQTDCIVELNSGAISRGYRYAPYPEAFILEELKSRGIPVTISSDAHHVDNIDFYFNEMLTIVKEHGFTSVKQLQGGKFIDVFL